MENQKIYTKTGDKGQTSLISGNRVPKSHIRVEAYGTVDELNCFVGLLRDILKDEHHKNMMLLIQQRLFIAEAILANDSATIDKNFPRLMDDDISLIEKEIDRMNEKLAPLTNFIIPGGHIAVSYAHVARSVCRRAERVIIRLSEQYTVDDIIIQYFNRLSDYFFMLARQLTKDLGCEEIIWKP